MTEDDDQPEPLPDWPGFDPEIMAVVRIVDDVVHHDGDEMDFVAALVAELGTETEALRVLAKAEMRSARTTRARVGTQLAVGDLASWDDRRCPTCQTLCEECLAEAEQPLRDLET